MADYPMCEKLSDTRDERESIEGFLDFLEGQGYHLAEYKTTESHTLVPVTRSRQELIFQHLEIDANELERERQAILQGYQNNAAQAAEEEKTKC